MKLTNRLNKAIELAAYYHHGYFRKSQQAIPYIVHPFAVAWIVANYTNDEDVVIAALLHDVLEDVKEHTQEEMKKTIIDQFGERVYTLVKAVTESKDPHFTKAQERATWRQRKQEKLDHLGHAGNDVLLISAADLLHNMMSFIESYKKMGPELWQHFNATPEEYIWIFTSMTDAIASRLSSPITRELNSALAEFNMVINVN